MSHQDWNQVILRNPKIAKLNMAKEIVKRQTHMTVKEADAETNPIKKVSGELKRKIIEVRLNYKEAGKEKAGVTQERLGQLTKVKAADIKLLEQGKMEMKQAKQIALSIEKNLRVKIL